MFVFHKLEPKELISVPKIVIDTWCSSWPLAGFAASPFASFWQCVESVIMCLLHILEVRAQKLWNTETADTCRVHGEKDIYPSLNKH